MAKPREVNDKERRFCEQVALGMEHSAAAAAAGYRGNAKTLKNMGWKILQRPAVKAYLEKLRKLAEERAVAKIEEVERILTEDLRADFGEITDAAGNLDLTKLRKMGRRIKSFTVSEKGVRIELNDRHGAIDRLAKIKGWYKPEKVEHSGKVQTDAAQYPPGFLDYVRKQVEKEGGAA